MFVLIITGQSTRLKRWGIVAEIFEMMIAWIRQQADKTSQRKLANRIGINHAEVSRLYHGKGNPMLSTMMKIEKEMFK